MTDQKPSVGRVVHYVAHGTPIREDGTQAFPPACRAATITEVGALGLVGLCVQNPTGLFFHSLVAGGCGYNSENAGGTWHWPERT